MGVGTYKYVSKYFVSVIQFKMVAFCSFSIDLEVPFNVNKIAVVDIKRKFIPPSGLGLAPFSSAKLMMTVCSLKRATHNVNSMTVLPWSRRLPRLRHLLGLDELSWLELKDLYRRLMHFGTSSKLWRGLSKIVHIYGYFSTLFR